MKTKEFKDYFDAITRDFLKADILPEVDHIFIGINKQHIGIRSASIETVAHSAFMLFPYLLDRHAEFTPGGRAWFIKELHILKAALVQALNKTANNETIH